MKGVYTGSAPDGQSRSRRLVMRQCRGSVNMAVYCQSEANHRAIEPWSRFHVVVREDNLASEEWRAVVNTVRGNETATDIGEEGRSFSCSLCDLDPLGTDQVRTRIARLT